MAFRKAPRGKSKRSNKMRRNRARKGYGLVRRYIRPNSLICTRRISLGFIQTQGAGNWTAVPYQFTLDQIPSYTEFQQLFDSYRINAVKLTFTPWFDGCDASQPGPLYFALPRVYTLVDRNGIPAGQINTEAKMLEYSRARQIKHPSRPFSIMIRTPGIEVLGEGALVSNPAVNMYRQYMDTSNPTIKHNGCAVGFVMPGGSGTATWNYSVVATFYLQFKTVL